MLRSQGSRWKRGALALATGALPALAFPEPSLWWLAYVALIPWLLVAQSAPTGRDAALTGWLGGTGFVLAVHHWLLPSLHLFILVLAALLGLLWAPWGWLVRRLLGGQRAGGARLLAASVLVPAGWLLVELVRSWEYLGGPWGLLGASQWQVAPALRLASIGGTWLVSFLLVMVNTALAALLTAPRARLPAVAVLAAVAVCGGTVWGWAPRPERAGEARIAVVQPGTTGSPSARFDRSEQLTRQLEDQQVDLVVWGESSVGYDLTTRPELRKRLASLASRVKAEVLVNVDARRDGHPGIFKSSVLVGPNGPTGERYDKMRLVPFGEYVPARSVLGWATSVGQAAGEDRRRGTESTLMDRDGLRFGPLVCFETAFPDMSRHLASEGARLLVAQSATSSFQDSWAPRQHASLAALRAAESWRPMVHATLTGVSAMYGSRGEPVADQLGTEQSGTLVSTVPLASGTSPYVRYGDWVLHLSVVALVVFGAVEAVRTLTSTRPRPQGADLPEDPAQDTVSAPTPR